MRSRGGMGGGFGSGGGSGGASLPISETSVTFGGSNNQVLTSDGAGGLTYESGLTYDGSTLSVTGTVSGPTNLIYTATGATQTIQPTADALALRLKCFNGTNTANVFDVQDKTGTNLFSLGCDGVITYGPAGSSWNLETTAGTVAVASSGLIRIGLESTGFGQRADTGAFDAFLRRSQGRFSLLINTNANTVNPTDATTYYVTTTSGLGTTDANARLKMASDVAGDVLSFYVWGSVEGTLGTTETLTLTLRKNGSDTACTLTTLTWNTLDWAGTGTCTGITTAVGDLWTIKVLTPTWATNPTDVRLWAKVLIRPTF